MLTYIDHNIGGILVFGEDEASLPLIHKVNVINVVALKVYILVFWVWRRLE